MSITWYRSAPTGLDDLGLAEALSDYVTGSSKHLGIPAHVQPSLEVRLPSEIETVLYRIVQEPLDNAGRALRTPDGSR